MAGLQLTDKQRTAKNRALLSTYNITLQEFEQILAEQGWKCAICEREYAKNTLFCVDHEHALKDGSGPVRGILCFRCNRYKLGNLSLPEVQRIASYLAAPPARRIVGERIGTKKKKKKYVRRRRPK